MQTVTLGRTGITATVAGLGTGGHSRVGFAKYGPDHAASIVRAAFDGGVNFIDSSAAYGTEGAVGQGMDGVPRDRYILSTKFPYRDKEGGIKSGGDLMAGLEASLKALRTDYVDIYHIHGVHPEHYAQACDALVPALIKAKEQGKIRFPGITEVFAFDTTHKTLQMAVPDDCFDVIMVGYNLLNPSAAKTVLPLTAERGIGTLCMFAVRDALSRPESLKADIAKMIASGQVDAALVKPDEDLSFLTEGGAAASVMEAAYRFCRHTPGLDVILTGTGSAEHLRENIASIQAPPLPDAILAKLDAMFGKVDCVSGE